MACETPIYVKLSKGSVLPHVPVPCGRCPPCKIRRVNEWCFRMMQEYKLHLHAHFVTLTYDTEHVPISDNGFLTLRKKDFQDYMKRLRKLVPDYNLKYYACGEYGTKNQRPHYHAIIFGVDDDQKFFDAWSLGGIHFGQVHVGKVTQDSVAYTMKYIDKSEYRKKHARDDRQAEFSLMSKGLGANYITDEIARYHKSDLSRMYVTRDGGHKVSLPRYYRDRIYSEAERDQQKLIAQQATEDSEAKLRLEYIRLYGTKNEGFTYEQFKESGTYARYYHFHNQKSRDL